MTNRTVTLPTADHGDVTLPEPSWCVGHESMPGDLRADILHQGPEIVLRFHGRIIGDAGLVQSPFAELTSREPGVSVSLLGQTLDPVGLYGLAATLDGYADQLRGLADQLDTIPRRGWPVSSYDPLHSPDETTSILCSLDVELSVTRRILEETAPLNIHSHDDMLQAAVALNCRVRALMAVLEAERGEGQ